LEIYSARISDIRTDVEFAKDYSSAMVKVSTETEGTCNHKLHVNVRISLKGKTVAESTGIVGRDGKASAEMTIDKPSLWMPCGYGSQDLYSVDVKLSAADDVYDSDSRTIGLRNVELVQEPDCHGKSFYFRINGVDIFCGGSVCYLVPVICSYTEFASVGSLQTASSQT